MIMVQTNLPVRFISPLASSATARTSAIPESVALSSLKVASIALAKSLARVVLPHLEWDTGQYAQRGHIFVYNIPWWTPENQASN